ncbi:hypothetical protein [Rhizorhabdus histidinilytica]|uniref:hypothetical protein n=1 Tax=Rhizorhabdus histidinilytica TaxID=439228 RepID=UPI00321FF6FE
MDITKKAVVAAAFLHLRSADDVPMYEDGPDGQPDLSKKVAIELHGPGSAPYNKAQAAAQNKMLERMRRKGKAQLTAEEQRAEQVDRLVACTVAFHHIEHPAYPGATGETLFRAVYSDPALGFIRDQALEFIGDWGNFTPSSNAA